MFGGRVNIGKDNKDEAEKPFWISYADMMTSLMVLFLVAMSVTLFAVTGTIDKEQELKDKRTKEIRKVCKQIEQAVGEFSELPEMNVKMKDERCTIDFGPQAHYARKVYKVTPEVGSHLRKFVKDKLLPIARTEIGKNWIKRVFVEGYASISGDYLLNLHLSLNRSHMVLCKLLDQDSSKPNWLSRDEQDEIRELFLVGGYSYNLLKETPEESRRVEFRLEFKSLEEKETDTLGRKPVVYKEKKVGWCRLKEA